MPLFTNLGCRIMLGVSRKSLIGKINREPNGLRRQPGSLAAGLLGLAGGASILRTHDVRETIQAVRTWHFLQTGDGDVFTPSSGNLLVEMNHPLATER